MGDMTNTITPEMMHMERLTTREMDAILKAVAEILDRDGCPIYAAAVLEAIKRLTK
jgi:hypothetical protein